MYVYLLMSLFIYFTVFDRGFLMACPAGRPIGILVHTVFYNYTEHGSFEQARITGLLRRC